VRDESENRAAALRYADLQAQVQMLGRATALGQLGSAIAHELNQPLASAANYVSASRTFLAKRPVDVDAAEVAASKALGEVFRASSIAKRLRTFVRSESLELNWIEIDGLIDEATQLGRLAVRQARATLSVEINPAISTVLADRIQIQQVLLNLIVNAAEAVADQDVREVRLSVDLRDSDEAIFSVSDTGLGVPEYLREALFKPFASTKSQGLGVGLAISKSIVESHGGMLWHHDSTEGGACFCFTIKCRELGDWENVTGKSRLHS
jgi:two-component system sensor kinase FixL